MTQLQVEKIFKEYPTRAEPLRVLGGVSLELQSGQNAAILGPSGSGKSTLLSIIGTLERPTSGRVLFEGEEPFSLAEPELADFRNRHIGFVFQEHYLLPQCSVLENVLIPAVAAGPISKETSERAKVILKEVGLENRLDHRPGELSGGERQRAALARALVLRPSLLLADEPTGNLDRKNADRVADLLLQLQQQEKMMLLVVTHSERLAAKLDRRWMLEDCVLK